jgi:AAA domain
VLAAPTGRAAKRLAELTGHEAATIHRLPTLRPGGGTLRPGSAAGCAGALPHAPRVGRGGNLNLLLQDSLTLFRKGAPERRYGQASVPGRRQGRSLYYSGL